VTMQRVVKWGDGWMPLNYAPGDEAVAAFDKLRRMAETAGRDPASIGIDTRTTVGIGAEAEWRETVRFWKSCGSPILPWDLLKPRASASHRRAYPG
jgi:alkanesulfonate monooxygenase SsuD/methylene tetrahydromethanopterin reductase-like flavin-dependent oxidoreductase (luciferase family)